MFTEAKKCEYQLKELLEDVPTCYKSIHCNWVLL